VRNLSGKPLAVHFWFWQGFQEGDQFRLVADDGTARFSACLVQKGLVSRVSDGPLRLIFTAPSTV
jgi:hypothetical protein